MIILKTRQIKEKRSSIYSAFRSAGLLKETAEGRGTW